MYEEDDSERGDAGFCRIGLCAGNGRCGRRRAQRVAAHLRGGCGRCRSGRQIRPGSRHRGPENRIRHQRLLHHQVPRRGQGQDPAHQREARFAPSRTHRGDGLLQRAAGRFAVGRGRDVRGDARRRGARRDGQPQGFADGEAGRQGPQDGADGIQHGEPFGFGALPDVVCIDGQGGRIRSGGDVGRGQCPEQGRGVVVDHRPFRGQDDDQCADQLQGRS